MVVQRLNEEISRQSNLGNQGLPPLQAVQSVNGLEMFGFLSPSIVQVGPPTLDFIFTFLLL